MTRREIDEAVNDLVCRWHTGNGDGVPLGEYLGMTEEQHARWARDCT